MNRKLVTLIICILIAAFPYWVYMPALALGIIVEDFYIEGVAFGFLIDILYGSRIHPSISFVFPYALVATFLVVVMLALRPRLRFNV